MKKKQAIIEKAIQLFAAQGFDATPSLQIAIAADVTEPLIFYHFKNKDGLFKHIINDIFSEYFACLETLDPKKESEFEKLVDLIRLHADFIRDNPEKSAIIVNTCPAKLRDPEHVCIRNEDNQRNWLKNYIKTCISNGMKKGEFLDLPLEATVFFVIAYLNGFVRQMVSNPLPGTKSKKGLSAFVEEAGEFLEQHGFPDVYNVLYGFEGELDEHHHRSTHNGWRFDGLPWEQC